MLKVNSKTMKNVLFKYTNCPNFKNTVAMTLSKYIFFLIFTFSFFTFNLSAQGVTRYGEYTNASNDYVDKNGKTESSSALDKTGNTTISSIPTVTSGGKIWMDRNLGATEVATSSTDAAAYGYLYQWGRGTDRHQIIISTTTSTLSSGDAPGNANFITATGTPYDWRSPQNDNLWQGVNGVNNPCPSGFRIPTKDELSAEMATWSSQNAAGAFASPLKLPLAGSRNSGGGPFSGAGYSVGYWSSTVYTSSISYSNVLYLTSSSADTSSAYGHAWGFYVRCIKN